MKRRPLRSRPLMTASTTETSPSWKNTSPRPLQTSPSPRPRSPLPATTAPRTARAPLTLAPFKPPLRIFPWGESPPVTGRALVSVAPGRVPGRAGTYSAVCPELGLCQVPRLLPEQAVRCPPRAGPHYAPCRVRRRRHRRSEHGKCYSP